MGLAAGFGLGPPAVETLKSLLRRKRWCSESSRGTLLDTYESTCKRDNLVNLPGILPQPRLTGRSGAQRKIEHAWSCRRRITTGGGRRTQNRCPGVKRGGGSVFRDGAMECCVGIGHTVTGIGPFMKQLLNRRVHSSCHSFDGPRTPYQQAAAAVAALAEMLATSGEHRVANMCAKTGPAI